MVLTPRLEQRQSQTLVMTPQLQQAIKLLQMNNLELSQFVEQELESNPLLERDDRDRNNEEAVDASAQQDVEKGLDEQVAPEVDNLEPINFEKQSDDVEISNEGGLDVDYDNMYNNSSEAGESERGQEYSDMSMGNYSSSGGGTFDDLPGLEETLSEKPTLREHLLDQLHMDIHDPVDLMIGQNLVGMVDGAGYISNDLESLAETLGCELERVEHTLAQLQEFDPVGIFARDLRECLALQLRDKDRLDPAMSALLDNLDMVAKREFTLLTRACGVDMEDITDMVSELRCLNPKPALNFEHEIVQSITPDVIMRPLPSDMYLEGAAESTGWMLELNTNNLPRVLVNNQYYAKVTKDANDKKELEYLSEQFQTANWLVKAMHQRATTILKVSSEIVRQQDGFFRHGVQHLRPLVLRDIAEVIEMHESTVSRVTSNKYITTPRGIYELKYFFTSSLGSSTGGDSISAESVRQKIKEMIDSEDPKKILSDDKIADILKADGTDVARRTVAKYRESLNLGSSVQRRREKSAPK
ncbi:MAG: RNA polymerase factor sigma-54 [Rhodospirillales bacterium]|jgi:RNA polymerase sigma-54 factor|nr:RNA polymerase factor sigma-54 [Rhodospirillales bacterium]